MFALFLYLPQSLAPIGMVAKQDRVAGRSVSGAMQSGEMPRSLAGHGVPDTV